MSGTLFIVATPIGNLKDITLRAVEILKEVDLVVCEDTRVTRKLLSHLGLQKRALSYFVGNEIRRTGQIVQEIIGGVNVALVSDAGSPGISDPGFLLVRACKEESIPVVSIPGASALTAAVSVSGLPANRLLFLGFPPRKPGARGRLLASLACDPSTVVFYESPVRVRRLLVELREALPGRDVVVLRELTKKFESCYFNPSPEELPERGEYTLVIAPPAKAHKVEDPGGPPWMEGLTQ